MCSKITCDNPIYRFFLIKNWNFTSSGYCRLFIALNNQETINEFITLINESLDYKGASLNGLVDVIGSSSINSYVNSYIHYYTCQPTNELYLYVLQLNKPLQ